MEPYLIHVSRIRGLLIIVVVAIVTVIITIFTRALRYCLRRLLSFRFFFLSCCSLPSFFSLFSFPVFVLLQLVGRSYRRYTCCPSSLSLSLTRICGFHVQALKVSSGHAGLVPKYVIHRLGGGFGGVDFVGGCRGKTTVDLPVYCFTRI